MDRVLSETLPRFEAGLEFAEIHTECTGHPNCQFPQFALGAGGSINLSHHFAIDADFNATPSSSHAADNFTGGRQTQFLAGLRAEVRSSKYGYFLRLQPGFVRWSGVITGMNAPFQFTYGARSTRATNIGGGFEYSPNTRTHIRFNASDIILATGSCCGENTFQSSVSVYGAFGKPLHWTRTGYDPNDAHRFFDKRNLVLLTGNLLAITADSITTQRNRSRGIEEGDPLAAPFANQGWAGQVSLDVLEMAGQSVIIYGFHRMHHHVLERLVPIGNATAHGVYAFQNTLNGSKSQQY
jgi:hypothetical protein